jgi:predicted site-specific integrase-resolvase
MAGRKRLATDDRKTVLKAKEAAKYLRVSLFTLNRIERQGLLVPIRTPGGHRRYTIEMLNQFLDDNRRPTQTTRVQATGAASSVESEVVQ